MKLTDFKRNLNLITKHLVKKPTGMFCKVDAKIYFPTRYVEANLVMLDDYIYFYGLAMLVIGKEHAVIRTPALLKTSTDSLKTVMVDDTEMFELSYLANDLMFETKIVQNGTLAYYSLNEFIIKGKIPSYVTQNDLTILYSKSNKFNGISLFDDPIKIEILTSVIARNKDNPNENYRHNLKGEMRWVGLGDKNYGYPDNLARLSGGYLDNALTTALTDDPTEQTSLEKQVLR